VTARLDAAFAGVTSGNGHAAPAAT